MSKLLVALLSLAGATVGFAVGRNLASPVDVHHVYEVAMVETSSYVDRHGRLASVGNWDSCLMVDPKIKGGRVYIPDYQLPSCRGEFFFLDTLVKARTAYATRAETKIYREDGTGAEPVVTEDKFCNDWIIGFGHIIINPEIEADGLCRVYLDTTSLKSDGSVGRRFVYLHELVLLCHNPQKK